MDDSSTIKETHTISLDVPEIGDHTVTFRWKCHPTTTLYQGKRI